VGTTWKLRGPERHSNERGGAIKSSKLEIITEYKGGRRNEVQDRTIKKGKGEDRDFGRSKGVEKIFTVGSRSKEKGKKER